MASGINKIKVKTALPPKTRKAPIYHNHLTTAKFTRPGIVYFKEVVPDQDVDIDVVSVFKMNPLYKPLLGSARLNLSAFFVPYRTINVAFNDYITDAPHTWSDNTASLVAADRAIANDAFIAVFKQPAYSTLLTNTTSPYDIWFSNETYPRVLTDFGRHSMKLLNSLGYKVFPYEDETIVHNANLLLSAARIYLDWFYPGAYYPIDFVITLKSFFENNNSNKYNILNNSEGSTILNGIFHLWYVSYYNQDYFNSAFDEPSGVNTNLLESTFNIPDPNDLHVNAANKTGFVTNGSTGMHNNIHKAAALTAGSNTAPLRVTQFGLELLNSISNYLRRHQIAGFRSIDRLLARFGFTNSPEKFNRSVLVSQSSIKIDIGTVFSNADTSGAGLGNYAGQMSGSSNEPFHFTYKNNSVDYGALIVVYNPMVDTSYCQGERRLNLNLDKLDHWTPEFDGRGMDAIAKSEVIVSPKESDEMGALDLGVFGYTPRYSHYKFGFDTLSGDFILNKRIDFESVWYLQRLLDNNIAASNVRHSLSQMSTEDCTQYFRLFADTDAKDALDYIRLIFRVQEQCTDHMLPVYDDYMLNHDDNGKFVDIHNQGSTVS